jgi:hypothetical protein
MQPILITTVPFCSRFEIVHFELSRRALLLQHRQTNSVVVDLKSGQVLKAYTPPRTIVGQNSNLIVFRDTMITGDAKRFGFANYYPEDD